MTKRLNILIEQEMRKAISGNIHVANIYTYTITHTYFYTYSLHIYTRHIKSTFKDHYLNHLNVDVGYIETIEISNPQCTSNVLLDIH